jgi:hypothetical protein
MEDFSGGIQLGVNEEEYRMALKEYHTGLVVNLKKNRQGRYSLHSSSCKTLCYDLESKEGMQKRRSGKLLFSDHAELLAWINSVSDLEMADLNRCRCLDETNTISNS